MTITELPVGTKSGPDDTIRIRLPLKHRVLIVLAALVYLFIAWSELHHDPLAGVIGVVIYVIAACAAITALGAIRMLFWGVDLTPEAAVVHVWRNRTIPWAEVEGVVAEKVGRNRCVSLHLTGQRRIDIRGQAMQGFSPSRAFDARFHIVAQYWATHHGPDQVYYNRDIGPYQETYLTGDLAELVLTAPGLPELNAAWILGQIGFLALVVPPLIVCAILGLVFSVSARSRLRKHGIPCPAKVSIAFRASVGALIMCVVLWAAIAALFLA